MEFSLIQMIGDTIRLILMSGLIYCLYRLNKVINQLNKNKSENAKRSNRE